MTMNRPSHGPVIMYNTSDMGQETHVDRKKVDAFWRARQAITDVRESTHFKSDETHVHDLALIREFTHPDSEVLDVACGTCYLSNPLAREVARIHAIDKFGEFLRHCSNAGNLTTEVADILTYEDPRLYDIILAFGIMNYFDDTDTQTIYAKLAHMLKPGGRLIVKHQSGIETDVIVDGYSEEIGMDYHALYRQHDRDRALLEEHFGEGNVETRDIYPEELNPWENTHFYAYICRREE